MRSCSAVECKPTGDLLNGYTANNEKKARAAGTAKATNKAKAASSASAVRRAQTRTAVNRAKPASTARKTLTRSVASTGKAATSTTKPASMTGPLPATVTLKHLAEWAGYNHGVPKKQATEMFTGFVEDIGRILKKAAKYASQTSGSCKCAFVPPARHVRDVIPGPVRRSGSRPAE